MNTLENSCFRYDGSDDSKNIIRIMNKNHRSNFKGNDKYFYWIANNIADTFYKMDKDLTEIPPYDYLALLTGKQLTEGERKDELEKLLVVGAKIKVGKKYAEENSCVEGEIFELVEGHFEYDNGLYTEDQTAPSIWEEISKEFNSIYHLFGNNLENFMDCEVLHSSHPETVPVQEEVDERQMIEDVLIDSQVIILESQVDAEREKNKHLQQQLKEAKEFNKTCGFIIEFRLTKYEHNTWQNHWNHKVYKTYKTAEEAIEQMKKSYDFYKNDYEWKIIELYYQSTNS